MEEDEDSLCPRARRNFKASARFVAAKDPAVMAVARMIVAGIDREYHLHPQYENYVRSMGEKKAQEHVCEVVTFPGACDIIQTDMTFGGIGLFGGLTENGQEFIFYEWTTPCPRLRIHMTHQEARDIVSGKQKIVTFKYCTKRHFAARERAKKLLSS